TRALRQRINEAAARLEAGLTFLASVGSTAPFVGLFGTVWGIYHALMSIATAGTISIDKVAGPVGEALLMTAFGLAVAIPAVLAYNAFTRVNRLLLAQLDGFAHDLHPYVTTGADTWRRARAWKELHDPGPRPRPRPSPASGGGEICARLHREVLSGLWRLRTRPVAFAADGRDQRHAAGRRDAGPAGDLHHH